MACRWCLTNLKQRIVNLVNDQIQYVGVENLNIQPANGNQKPAALTNKKEIIVTKNTVDSIVKRSGSDIYRKKQIKLREFEHLKKIKSLTLL